MLALNVKTNSACRQLGFAPRPEPEKAGQLASAAHPPLAPGTLFAFSFERTDLPESRAWLTPFLVFDSEVATMAMRSSWQGYLRLNLISVPVRAYSAAALGHGKIAFHQLHSKCHNRIRYKKVCPVHGEVPNEEIVSGYEAAKGQYVVIDPKELAKLRGLRDKMISIDAFIDPAALDPMYFTDRTYYLAPEGKVGQKPYAVLRNVMADENRYGIAIMVLSGREQLAVVRVVDNVLTATMLTYAAQMKKPSAIADEMPDVSVSADETDLARTLVERTTVKDFDFSAYKDKYTSEVSKLIERKAAGQKIVAATKEEEPAVINLMDALRQSLEATSGGGKRAAGRPAKIAHPSRNGKKHRGAGRTHDTHGKRKTG